MLICLIVLVKTVSASAVLVQEFRFEMDKTLQRTLITILNVCDFCEVGKHDFVCISVIRMWLEAFFNE